MHVCCSGKVFVTMTERSEGVHALWTKGNTRFSYVTELDFFETEVEK